MNSGPRIVLHIIRFYDDEPMRFRGSFRRFLMIIGLKANEERRCLIIQQEM